MHKSLHLLYRSVPPTEVPFTCLEINLRTKWTEHWQGDKAACTVCSSEDEADLCNIREVVFYI